MIAAGDAPVLRGFSQLSEGVPREIELWVHDEPLLVPGWPDPVEVTVIIDAHSSWDDIDQATVQAVLTQGNALIDIAVEYLAQTLRTHPEILGLHPDETLEYLDAESLGLGDPEYIFYSDGTWLVRFAEGGFPVCDPYGIGVVGAAMAALRVEDLRDADEVSA